MRNLIKFAGLLLLTLIAYKNACSQGCSDAGFCTAGALKPNTANKAQSQGFLGLSMGFGLGEQNVSTSNVQFEPQFKVNDLTSVQIKIPFVANSGKLGKTQGLGDVILTCNYNLDSVLHKKAMLVIGTRIATGTASLKSNNIALPMPYQISLGTTDLIIGTRFNLPKKFIATFAYQQPLWSRNQNGFDSAAFFTTGAFYNLTEEQNYFLSANLKRRGDILLRIERPFSFKKSILTVGVLPIYHLGQDKADVVKGKSVKIKNSQGLTLNLNGIYTLNINDHTEFNLILAAPLIVRSSRPDGLTRSAIINAGLKYFL